MRVWTLDEIFRRWPSLWFRIAFESTLPTLAALIWGGRAFITTGSLFGAVTAAGIAFPLVLFVQGQILRMAKNVRDDQNAARWTESFASIEEALRALQRYPPPVTPAPLSPAEIPIGASLDRDYFRESKRAIDQGFLIAGALAAATGFERAVRDTALALDLSPRVPLGRLLDELSNRLGRSQWTEELHAMLKLRNALVHTDVVEIQSIEQAHSIRLRFIQGASLITSLTVFGRRKSE